MRTDRAAAAVQSMSPSQLGFLHVTLGACLTTVWGRALDAIAHITKGFRYDSTNFSFLLLQSRGLLPRNRANKSWNAARDGVSSVRLI